MGVIPDEYLPGEPFARTYETKNELAAIGLVLEPEGRFRRGPEMTEQEFILWRTDFVSRFPETASFISQNPDVRNLWFHEIFSKLDFRDAKDANQAMFGGVDEKWDPFRLSEIGAHVAALSRKIATRRQDRLEAAESARRYKRERIEQTTAFLDIYRKSLKYPAGKDRKDYCKARKDEL
jgi:hypothetical protein